MARPDSTTYSDRMPYPSQPSNCACVPVEEPWLLCVSKPFNSVPATRVPLLLIASLSSIDRAQILSDLKKGYAVAANFLPFGPLGSGGLVASLTGNRLNPVLGSFGSQLV